MFIGWGDPLTYHFANCALDAKRHELRRDGVLCHVEPQVLDLLIFLIENRDRVLSRDEIFQVVWRGRIVSDSVLSTRINAVRKAVGDSGAEQRLIRTLHGKGFRFAGTLREQHVGAAPTPSAISEAHRVAFVSKDAPTVIVLPFKNIGGDPADDPFAVGLSEEVWTALAKVGWFFVISWQPASGVDGARGGLKEAARRYNSTYVLRGSIRRMANRVRVVVHLMDGATEHYIWAQRYEHHVDDALMVQDDITAKLTAAISCQLYAAENRRAKFKSRESLGAWDCVVRALSLMNTRERQHVGAARAMLQRAIAIDPRCAPAYSLLSFVSTLGVHLGWHSRKLTRPIGFAFAQKALELDEEDSWGHVALGYATLQLANQPVDAIDVLRGALKLNSNLAIAHYFIALALTYAGDTGNAFCHADMAERLQERDLLARGNAGAHDNVRATASFVAGRYREGIQFARMAIIQSPRQIPAYRQLVTNCALAGEIGQAADALRRVNQFAPDVQRWIQESEQSWGRTDDYKRYLEGFRMAGFK